MELAIIDDELETMKNNNEINSENYKEKYKEYEKIANLLRWKI